MLPPRETSGGVFMRTLIAGVVAGLAMFVGLGVLAAGL